MYSNFYKMAEVETAETWKTGIYKYSNIYDIAKISEYYYGVGSSGKIVFSLNGKAWFDLITLENAGSLYSIINLVGNHEYYDTNSNIYRQSQNMSLIIGENVIYKSYNFEDFINVTPDFVSNNLTCGTIAFNKFYIAGHNGLLVYSEDGENWTEIQSNVTGTISSLRFFNNVLYACGNDGIVLKSNDGLTWEKYQLTGYESINFLDCIMYNNVFYVCGENNTILFSLDFQNWTIVSCNFPSNTSLKCFASGLTELYVFGLTGEIGKLNTDTDVVTQTSTTNNIIEKVIFDLPNYIGVGGLNFYMDSTQVSTIDVPMLMLDASNTALETIIKEIVIINENNISSHCSLWLQNDLEKTHLITQNTILEPNQVLMVLNKPMILNKNDKLYFKGNTVKSCASVLYSYGD